MSLRVLSQPFASSSCYIKPKAKCTSRCWRQATPPCTVNSQRAPQHAAGLKPISVLSARRSVIMSSSVHTRDKHPAISVKERNEQPTISAKERQQAEDLVHKSLLKE